MGLPGNFLFSQGNLQDFIDCRRRFQLRHLDNLTWPAIKSEPVLENEIAIVKGQRFHRLVNGYFLGIPAESLTQMADANNVLDWWQKFLDYTTTNSEIFKSKTIPEATCQVEIAKHRLIARYDLLVIGTGQTTIYDWKTSRTRPKKSNLASRMQTRIYPFLLVERGAGQVDPGQVAMNYWFCDFPSLPEQFHYSQEQYQQDRKYLLELVGIIEGLGDDEYSMTEREENCRTCVYRSLCNRGIEAGKFLNDMGDLDEKGEISLPDAFDFASIPEIEY